jgi:hypothetical protein
MENKQKKDQRKEFGVRGEAEALVFLVKKLFRLEQKNWYVLSSLNLKKRIQVDLVVSRDECFYIVEVKSHIWKSTGFESLISESQRRRLLMFTYSLQRLKYGGKSWGFLLVWICGAQVKILERVEAVDFS